MSSANQASMSSSAVRRFPYPGSYAIAVMDIEASIMHIEDPEVKAVALKMKPMKCLVWVNKVRCSPLVRVHLRSTTSRPSCPQTYLYVISQTLWPDSTAAVTQRHRFSIPSQSHRPRTPSRRPRGRGNVCNVFSHLPHRRPSIRTRAFSSGTCLSLYELLPLVRNGPQIAYQERPIHARHEQDRVAPLLLFVHLS